MRRWSVFAGEGRAKRAAKKICYVSAMALRPYVPASEIIRLYSRASAVPKILEKSLGFFNRERLEKQIPPLRFAAVGMTTWWHEKSQPHFVISAGA